jgi:hypothetical protein
VLDGFVDVHSSELRGATRTQKETILSDLSEVLETDYALLESYAQSIAEQLPESGWSVDFIQTVSGEWYCIDMSLYGIYWNERESNWHNISHIPEENPFNIIENRESIIPPDPE